MSSNRVADKCDECKKPLNAETLKPSEFILCSKCYEKVTNAQAKTAQ